MALFLSFIVIIISQFSSPVRLFISVMIGSVGGIIQQTGSIVSAFIFIFTSA
jgi:hypothetical protein